jgi:hypothetical protein
LPADDVFALPVYAPGTDGAPYLITSTDLGFCGSGGCMSAVMILRNGKMYMITDGNGIMERQAMIIAREALENPPK